MERPTFVYLKSADQRRVLCEPDIRSGRRRLRWGHIYGNGRHRVHVSGGDAFQNRWEESICEPTWFQGLAVSKKSAATVVGDIGGYIRPSARDSSGPLRRRLHNDLPGHRADRPAGRPLRNAEAARFALDSLLEEGGFEPLVPRTLNATKAGESDNDVYFARMRLSVDQHPSGIPIEIGPTFWKDCRIGRLPVDASDLQSRSRCPMARCGFRRMKHGSTLHSPVTVTKPTALWQPFCLIDPPLPAQSCIAIAHQPGQRLVHLVRNRGGQVSQRGHAKGLDVRIQNTWNQWVADKL
jgi:hypothetical protein